MTISEIESGLYKNAEAYGFNFIDLNSLDRAYGMVRGYFTKLLKDGIISDFKIEEKNNKSYVIVNNITEIEILKYKEDWRIILRDNKIENIIKDGSV
jgi:hypothetical protein